MHIEQPTNTEPFGTFLNDVLTHAYAVAERNAIAHQAQEAAYENAKACCQMGGTPSPSFLKLLRNMWYVNTDIIASAVTKAAGDNLAAHDTLRHAQAIIAELDVMIESWTMPPPDWNIKTGEAWRAIAAAWYGVRRPEAAHDSAL